MNLSDHVRSHFYRNYVSPARERNQRRVQVAVSDISRHFNWSDRFPLICSALAASTFHDELGVELISASDPCPSSTTIFTFGVAS